MASGVGSEFLGKAEDSAHASGDTGIMLLAVRTDVAAALAAAGDYVPLIVDASGRLHIAPLPAGSEVLGKARLVDSGGTEITEAVGHTVKASSAQLPTSLAAGGGMKVEGVAGGVAQPVSMATAPALVAGTATIGGTTDAGPAWTSIFGVSGAAVVSADATGNPAVTDAPAAGQKLVITDIVYSSDTAMSLTFSEETSGTVIFKVFVPANGTGQITPRGKKKLATADKKLMCDASVAGNIAVTVGYYSEA